MEVSGISIPCISTGLRYVHRDHIVGLVIGFGVMRLREVRWKPGRSGRGGSDTSRDERVRPISM